MPVGGCLGDPPSIYSTLAAARVGFAGGTTIHIVPDHIIY